MLEGEFFCFDGMSLKPCTDTVTEVHLAAADSFLVEDGRVRSLASHYERFGAWVLESAPQLAPNLAPFFAQVSELISRDGRWFPRLELHLATADGYPAKDTLYLRLRRAPDQLGSLVLWTLDEPDPRLNPSVKGPDLSLCMQLRRRAQLHGADEAVILDAGGYLVEGALSSIVWWRGDVLCAPDNQNSWLESITRNEIFELARVAGFATRLEHVKPADLVGCEIWALSSLQGIRAVSDWLGLGSPVGPATHLEKFQKRLRLLAGPIG